MKLGQKKPGRNPEPFTNSNIAESVAASKPDFSEMGAEELAEAFLVALKEDDELTQAKIANEIFESI